MTYKVVLTVTQADASAAIPSPSGIGPGKIRFAITDSNQQPVNSQDVDGLEATFTGLNDGNFTATAQQLDLNGNPIGDAVTTTFVDGQVVPPAAATFQPLTTLSAVATQE